MSKQEKKELKLKVEETLATTFTDLSGNISPKKFKRNLRRASRALLAGLKVTTVKKSPVKKAKKNKEVIAIVA